MQAQLATFEICVMMKNAVFGSSFLKDFHTGNELPLFIEGVPKRIRDALEGFPPFFVVKTTVYSADMLGRHEAVVEKRLGAKGLSFLIQDKLCMKPERQANT